MCGSCVYVLREWHFAVLSCFFLLVSGNALCRNTFFDRYLYSRFDTKYIRRPLVDNNVLCALVSLQTPDAERLCALE